MTKSIFFPFILLMALNLRVYGDVTPKESAVAQNGWTLLTEQNPRSRLVHLRIVIRGGALADPKNAYGLSHLCARALLRGTENRPFDQLTYDIESMGGILSVDGDWDQVILSGSVLSENFDAFLQLIQEILTKPSFNLKEVTQLKKLIKGEIQSSLQDTRHLAQRATLELAYKGKRLATPVEGQWSDIKKISQKQLRAFFKKNFVRENMIFAVVGPFSPESIEGRIEKNLKTIPHGKKQITRFPLPNLRGWKAGIVSKKDMGTVPYFVAIPSVGDSDPKILALELSNFVFGADFTSRLIQILRAKNGWTYGAYSGYHQLIPPKETPTLFSTYAYPSAKFAELAIPKNIELIEDYAQKGITPEELASAKKSLINSYPFELNTAEKNLLGRLRQLLTGRPWLSVGDFTQKIQALTLDEVNQAIKKKTSLKNLAIVAVGDPPRLKKIFKGIKKIKSIEVLKVKP